MAQASLNSAGCAMKCQRVVPERRPRTLQSFPATTDTSPARAASAHPPQSTHRPLSVDSRPTSARLLKWVGTRHASVAQLSIASTPHYYKYTESPAKSQPDSSFGTGSRTRMTVTSLTRHMRMQSVSTPRRVYPWPPHTISFAKASRHRSSIHSVP